MLSRGRHADDILNINVGGKKFTVRRTDLLADPRSRLAEWFRPGAVRGVTTDKGGNVYLDRDSKTFRHILAYLRLKKERLAVGLALPAKPDELARLVGECEALQLLELREMALELLQKYRRTDEQHFVTSYVQHTLHYLEGWQFERDQQPDQQQRPPHPSRHHQQSQEQPKRPSISFLHHQSPSLDDHHVAAADVGGVSGKDSPSAPKNGHSTRKTTVEDDGDYDDWIN